jgi:hypothetical protein
VKPGGGKGHHPARSNMFTFIRRCVSAKLKQFGYWVILTNYWGKSSLPRRKVMVLSLGRVAYNKAVRVGDSIWVWRSTALVRKVVIGIHTGRFSWQKYIYAEYADSPHPMPEEPKRCYISQEDARRARPDLARRMEHCLVRAGRNMGRRNLRVAA